MMPSLIMCSVFRVVIENSSWFPSFGRTRIAHDASGHSGDDRIRGHIFRDNSAGADEGTFTYREAAQNRRVGADRGASLDPRRLNFPIRFGLRGAVRVRCQRKAIIGEHYAVSDEAFVFHSHSLTNEGVRGNLAACADRGVLLYLHERADFCVGPYCATVKVHERRMEDFDVVAEAHAVRYGHARKLRMLVFSALESQPRRVTINRSDVTLPASEE